MDDVVQVVVHLELIVQSFLMLRDTEICEVLINRRKLIPLSKTAQALAGRTTKCDLGGSEALSVCFERLARHVENSAWLDKAARCIEEHRDVRGKRLRSARHGLGNCGGGRLAAHLAKLMVFP